MASDWAAVVLADCREITDAQFLAGCRNARRECNDHRGILKAILAGAAKSNPYASAARFASEWAAAVEGPSHTPRLSGPRKIGELIERD